MMSWNIIEKFLCIKFINVIEIKSCNNKDFELVFFFIYNSGVVFVIGSFCVNFGKKCFFGEVFWEVRELDINNINMVIDIRRFGLY